MKYIKRYEIIKETVDTWGRIPTKERKKIAIEMFLLEIEEGNDEIYRAAISRNDLKEIEKLHKQSKVRRRKAELWVDANLRN